MQTTILGDGPMGRALADRLTDTGHSVTTLGRPAVAHPVEPLADADVVFDFSVAGAVRPNLHQALEAGCRRVVIGTTGWDADRAAVEAALAAAGASAVATANFSPGVALFAQLATEAARLFGPLAEYDPFVVEWHRSSKRDRPSGTAKELVRRLTAAHPRKLRMREPDGDGPITPDELEVASVRAGASPGMHLVGFDAPGETLELRLTARDRSAYAAGAIAAAGWLLRAVRDPGFHGFDAVIADLTTPLPAGAA